MNSTWFYSRNLWWAWKSSGHKRPNIWETTPTTSWPSWRTPTLATCTRQVTRTDIKQCFILIKVNPVFICVSPPAPRWVREVLQRRGAHGSLGRTARSERFRGVYLGAPHTISFDSLPVPVVPFQLRALTQVLQLPIDVVQSSSAAIKIGEEFDGEPITLVYVIASIAAIRIHGSWHGSWCDHLYEPVCWPVPAGICVTRMDSESITILWSG